MERPQQYLEDTNITCSQMLTQMFHFGKRDKVLRGFQGAARQTGENPCRSGWEKASGQKDKPRSPRLGTGRTPPSSGPPATLGLCLGRLTRGSSPGQIALEWIFWGVSLIQTLLKKKADSSDRQERLYSLLFLTCRGFPERFFRQEPQDSFIFGDYICWN